jgi:hypothetical protein
MLLIIGLKDNATFEPGERVNRLDVVLSLASMYTPKPSVRLLVTHTSELSDLLIAQKSSCEPLNGARLTS